MDPELCEEVESERPPDSTFVIAERGVFTAALGERGIVPALGNGSVVPALANGGISTDLGNGDIATGLCNGCIPNSLGNGGFSLGSGNGGFALGLTNGGFALSSTNGGLALRTNNGGLGLGSSNGGFALSSSNGGFAIGSSNGNLALSSSNSPALGSSNGSIQPALSNGGIASPPGDAHCSVAGAFRERAQICAPALPDEIEAGLLDDTANAALWREVNQGPIVTQDIAPRQPDGQGKAVQTAFDSLTPTETDHRNAVQAPVAIQEVVQCVSHKHRAKLDKVDKTVRKLGTKYGTVERRLEETETVVRSLHPKLRDLKFDRRNMGDNLQATQREMELLRVDLAHLQTENRAICRTLEAQEEERQMYVSALTSYAQLCSPAAAKTNDNGMLARCLRLAGIASIPISRRQLHTPKWQAVCTLPDHFSCNRAPAVHEGKIYVSLERADRLVPHSIRHERLREGAVLQRLASSPDIDGDRTCVWAWVAGAGRLYCLVHPAVVRSDLYPFLFEYRDGVYHMVAMLPERKTRYCAGFVGSRLFIVGGWRYSSARGMKQRSSTVYSIELRRRDAGDDWRRWPDMPTHGSHGRLVATGSWLHVLGRHHVMAESCNSVFSLDTATTYGRYSWSEAVVPPLPARLCGAVAVNDNMIVGGGFQDPAGRRGGSGVISSLVRNCVDRVRTLYDRSNDETDCRATAKTYVYVGESERWMPLPDLNFPRYCPCLLHCGDRIVCIGGRSDDNAFSREVEILQL